ncbi:F-box only protein 48 [Latimeria chalumnae]|uniref:F-box only protein 48 n=1 Tax=Latimeria chalumnae TaxID=7897 RepID=UPI0006D91BDB|nr:PREDICTED: F-box only protein 48 [Latimeria chalumnae]|eukprot:XP_014344386.1 PREDICTED: F-box only protein 48 [Latimeria chalumnae]
MQKNFKRPKQNINFIPGQAPVLSGLGSKRIALNFVELLPPEVTVKIFNYLDIKSLCNASVTCKTWNSLIEESDYLWKNHCSAVRAVCQKEIDRDRDNGCSWKVTLLRNFWKSNVKQAWLSGQYNNIHSANELPEKSMYPMDVETWGEILEELER